MGKRVKIVLGVVLFVGLVGVVRWQALQPFEPTYAGRKLTSWISVYWDTNAYDIMLFRTSETDKADKAVSQIGTNAIPTLLRLLRAQDSALKIKLMDLVQRQHIINIKYTPAEQWNQVARRGFWILGTNAQTAVPELIAIVDKTTSPPSRKNAILTLAFSGSRAKEALPSLFRWATNADTTLQIPARFAILRIDREAAAKAGITNSTP